jgi:hypothetical protein
LKHLALRNKAVTLAMLLDVSFGVSFEVSIFTAELANIPGSGKTRILNQMIGRWKQTNSSSIPLLHNPNAERIVIVCTKIRCFVAWLARCGRPARDVWHEVQKDAGPASFFLIHYKKFSPGRFHGIVDGIGEDRQRV